MSRFISEDDLYFLDTWLQYQGIDRTFLSDADLRMWKSLHDEAVKRMKESPQPKTIASRKLPKGEKRYAVAVEDAGNLWLTLWIRESVKKEFFVMIPRGDKSGDHHTSYHRDGTMHSKSHGHKFEYGKHETIPGAFHGIVRLGTYHGHAPKNVGAICDPIAFSWIVKIKAGLLGPKHGAIAVDLIEPGYPLRSSEWERPWFRIESQHIFGEESPQVVITVLASIYEDSSAPLELSAPT